LWARTGALLRAGRSNSASRNNYQDFNPMVLVSI
jgi:hypothetical protein